MSRYTQTLLRPIGLAVSSAFEPLFTGPLLLALTQGPPQIRDPILRALGPLAERDNLATLVKALKWLVAVGLLGKVNKWLNAWAVNNWQLRTKKSQWVWEKEIAVITGGCAGIGLSVVENFLKKGVRVAVIDISPPPESFKNNPNVMYFQCDVTKPSAIHETAEAIRSSMGPPSILINNAGIGSAKSILDTSNEWLLKIFGVNLFAHYSTVQEFLPDMIKKDKGHVVTIASMASYVAPAGIADYAASKAGALAFHEVLTQELKHHYEAPNVLTTSVHPNWTRTAIVAGFEDQLEAAQGKLMTPDFVGSEICKRVFSCRGGNLLLPNNLRIVSGIRGWPNWMQELIRDAIAKGTVDAVPNENLKADTLPVA